MYELHDTVASIGILVQHINDGMMIVTGYENIQWFFSVLRLPFSNFRKKEKLNCKWLD